MKPISLLLALHFLLLLSQAQDEGENLNIKLGENPYIFLYYDVEEKLDDMYDLREKINSDKDLLEKGEGVPYPEPEVPESSDGDTHNCGDAAASTETTDEVEVYNTEYQIFVDRKAPPIPTFLGYVNITEEN